MKPSSYKEIVYSYSQVTDCVALNTGLWAKLWLNRCSECSSVLTDLSSLLQRMYAQLCSTIEKVEKPESRSVYHIKHLICETA
jgi:hypothetical protein